MPTMIRGMFCLLLLAASSAVSAQSDPIQPHQLVADAAGAIIGKINSNFETYSADPGLLEQVIRSDLLPLLDMHYTARLILGRAGRQASEQQVAEFSEAMSNLLIERYSSGLMNYRSEEQLEVLPLRGDLNERATRVRTRVRLNQGGFALVDYVFRKTDDGWKAFDVVIEGISYVSTYRNQIMPQVEAEGIDSVVSRLNSGDLVLQE